MSVWRSSPAGGGVKKQLCFEKMGLHFRVSQWNENEFPVEQMWTCRKGDIVREILPKSAPEE